MAALKVVRLAETAFGLHPIPFILGPMAQPIPWQRSVICVDMRYVAIEFVAKLGVALSHVLPCCTQVEDGQQKLPPSCGMAGVRPDIALPESDRLHGVFRCR